jgi:hypothetical protein
MANRLFGRCFGFVSLYWLRAAPHSWDGAECGDR